MDQMKRKGSKTIQGIPSEILVQLNHGKIETANLVEWLAIDIKEMLSIVLAQCNKSTYLKPTLEALEALKKPTITLKNATIGQVLLAETLKTKDHELFTFLSQHPADMPRCWATYMVGCNTTLSPIQQLNAIQPFAADTHFGVRETAWMAVRPTIIENLTLSLEVLEPWTLHSDANIRRFATEATRPRGVWCAHIDALKSNPSLALPLLENLRNDPVKYVQDSVGNWLNDASKTQPDFVQNLCDTWLAESNTKATTYIVKKALRTLKG
ncbi:DNA alkylation repair protein [Myroides sp. 1354]|uniref:DNA alkylation repair protein n=1 Tax=unclassified Myroides TaxID=2642485 RepID=UPI002576222B|nr:MULTISPECIES: DNA alkylation repair protein [unclassified Myroides]MDM1046069.1 DNA alkylation repair protein [Myroides sp. R163-1]MDM1057005.1 DNA alkylation repair protein [Myroides sp. 1354]MDM1070200.1 DNA alkylation repair protein [Myroides sp. 1372]